MFKVRQMSIGVPVIFDATNQNPQFKPLTAISTGGDDPASFKEKLLQQLISEEPSILPVQEFLPSTSALFSLGREIPVDIGGDGYIDNLLVTNDGHLVIVETKLYRSPEAIRQVVTQILQYAMAVSQMSVTELEARIRKGQRSALRPDESISDCVARLASNIDGSSSELFEDFDTLLERNLRRGEVLLLIASDAIRIGVSRVTRWLSEQATSAPFKFGLVELKFYQYGDQRIVIPRALLRTREVSRHVVVVDIQSNPDVTVTSRVTDTSKSTAGGKIQESRPIKAAGVPLTKTTLLQLLGPEAQQAASRIIDQFEVLGFDQEGTPATLKIGFASENGEFHSMVGLDKSGVWVGPLKKDSERLGANELLLLRNGVNQFAPFFSADQLTRSGFCGRAGKYQHLEQSAADFAAFLNGYRIKLIELADQDRS